MTTSRAHYTVAPSAARLTESLRDIGYDFPSAVADILDNSIAAGASIIDVHFEIGPDPHVLIADDGHGMSAQGIMEALRFGSRSTYDRGDLGRYGLGLKTASISQCRRVTVVSRRLDGSGPSMRQLDLDVITRFDDWLIIFPPAGAATAAAEDRLREGMSTVVVWESLDRVLPSRKFDGMSRRRLETLRRKTVLHLSMVFHRFLSGAAGHRVRIRVNGEDIPPWDPFAEDEEASRELSAQTFEVGSQQVVGQVRLRRWVLPARERFSNPEQFDRLSGPLKWNRQQGIYIYRANRLVQWGGWAGIRAIDEHTKLARASIDFDTDLDEAFTINVAKMRVSLPLGLKQMLDRPLAELCQEAEASYRHTSSSRRSAVVARGDADVAHLAAALITAAVSSGHFETLREIGRSMAVSDPEAATALGIGEL